MDKPNKIAVRLLLAAAVLALPGCGSWKKVEVKPVAIKCNFPAMPRSCDRSIRLLEDVPMTASQRAEIDAFRQLSPEEKIRVYQLDGERITALLDVIIKLRRNYADEVRHYRNCQAHIARVRKICR